MAERETMTVCRVGQIVQSVSGRDRYRVFAVIDIEEGNDTAPLVIADGRLRKIEDRKHKNPRHLRPLGAVGEMEIKALVESGGNVEIAKLCEKHDISQKK